MPWSPPWDGVNATPQRYPWSVSAMAHAVERSLDGLLGLMRKGLSGSNKTKSLALISALLEVVQPGTVGEKLDRIESRAMRILEVYSELPKPLLVGHFSAWDCASSSQLTVTLADAGYPTSVG